MISRFAECAKGGGLMRISILRVTPVFAICYGLFGICKILA